MRRIRHKPSYKPQLQTSVPCIILSILMASVLRVKGHGVMGVAQVGWQD